MRRLLVALGLALGLIGCLGAVRAADQSERGELKRVVIEEALKSGFPPSLALAVAEAASDFDPHAQGPGDRRGLMQLRPATAAALGEPDPAKLWEARVNARLGIGYLQQLVRLHGGRLEPALSQFAQGAPPDKALPAVPSAFVHRVLRLRDSYRSESRLWIEALKGEAMPWDDLRPNDAALLRLAALARQSGGQWPDIERRRRAMLPYLDDFAGAPRP